ncbi:MAG: hypothetical protein RLY31_536 [Bacteroidota bacterium]
MLLIGCQEETLDPIVRLGGAPTLTAPSDNGSYVLAEADAAEVFAVFSWTPADFGFQAAISYTLEMDQAGNDFAAAVTLGVTNGLSLEDVTVEKVNNILLAKELEGGVATPTQIRVRAKVSNDVQELVSAPLTMVVTPYESVVDYPKLQVPGNYQGWDPSNESTVIHSLRSDGMYEGFLFFSTAGTEYKFTQGYSWDVNWGDDGADGSLDPGGANILAAEVGMHRLNVDLNTLTFSSQLTNWGLIGSATPNGWDSDIDMIYDDAGGYLTLTTDLVAGEIKFRANDDWAINLGDDGPNGKLEYDGANIAIGEAGNYTIDLLLNDAKYTYRVTKN